MECKPHDLEFYIEESGLKIGYICDKLGFTRSTFNNKRKQKTKFKPCEIVLLAELLSIPDCERGIIFNFYT